LKGFVGRISRALNIRGDWFVAHRAAKAALIFRSIRSDEIADTFVAEALRDTKSRLLMLRGLFGSHHYRRVAKSLTPNAIGSDDFHPVRYRKS
jgi:hypothetical protein